MRVLCILCIILLYAIPAYSTIFFFEDAESGIVGEDLPHHQTTGNNFCQEECGSSNLVRGVWSDEGYTPNGTQYMRWNLNMIDGNTTRGIYCTVKNKDTFPVSMNIGSTYYIAFFFRFDRIDGLNIWGTGSTGYDQSADKGIEMYGHGIRWIASRGQWDVMDNEPNKFTVWMGNPSYHFNEQHEPYYPNVGYVKYSTAPQLDYETWYSLVFGVTMATNDTGAIVLYLNGTKIIENTGIRTAEDSSPDIDLIDIDGTIAQPEGLAPPHTRKYDAMMVTDDWQDIIDGGYLADPEEGEATVQYELTLNKIITNGDGTITSSPAGINCATGTCTTDSYDFDSTTLDYTTLVTLSNDGDPVVWGGDCNINGEVTMTEDKTCTATFTAPQQYTLTITKVEVNGAGIITSSPGSIDCGSTCFDDFDQNSNVELTSVGDDGVWSVDCSGTTDNPITVNMGTANKNCTVTYDSGTPAPPAAFIIGSLPLIH